MNQAVYKCMQYVNDASTCIDSDLVTVPLTAGMSIPVVVNEVGVIYCTPNGLVYTCVVACIETLYIMQLLWIICLHLVRAGVWS